MMIALALLVAVAFGALVGVSLGGRLRDPEVTRLQQDNQRLRALTVLAGKSEEDFIVQSVSKGVKGCPICDSTTAYVEDCSGRCNRGNKHVHFQCSKCRVEWIRIP